MIIEPLAIADVVLLRPRRIGDSRGYFCETFNARLFREKIADVVFVQDNEAFSAAEGTLRGLHFQRPPMAQGKLVRAVKGAILDVVVDIRRGSPSFGRHVAARLDAAEGTQLWVPVGFAHGYCTLEPDTELFYKVDGKYAVELEGGVAWNDPDLAIAWPLDGEPVLSEKDQRLPRLKDLPPVDF